MWLLFQLLRETGDEYIYAYSRENRNLDGEIKYNKASKEAVVTRPCKNDRTQFAQKNAKRSFRFVVEEGFPKQRMVAYG